MGQKANPIGIRLGIIRDWDSTWFSQKGYSKWLLEDFEIRKYVREKLHRAGVARIALRRKSEKVQVNAFVGRPGVVFGKNGIDVSVFEEELSKKYKKNIAIKVVEQKNPQNNAKLVSESVVQQLEKRIPFRRAMKMAVQIALKSGAYGVKVSCGGRLGGVEIARREWYREGKVPLQTFRADVDYAFSEALTTYGKIGVKVWIYNGEVHGAPKKQADPEAVEK